jgi:hypothetical protein
MLKYCDCEKFNLKILMDLQALSPSDYKQLDLEYHLYVCIYACIHGCVPYLCLNI